MGTVISPVAVGEHSVTAGSAEAVDQRAHVLILASGLGLGGAETVIRLLAHAIDPRRFRITLGCVKTLGVVGRQLAAEGADIFCLTDPKAKGVDYFTSLELRRIVRARGIRLIHTHTTDSLTDAVVCKLLVPGVKVVHTFHFGNYPHIGSRILWMERVFSRLADRLVAVGEVQRRQIRSVFGLSEQRIGMIWNGILPAACPSHDTFRVRIGAGDRLIIGTIATLTEQKGLRDLMRVAQRLKSQADRLCFVIVGDGHLRDELDAMRRDLGVEDMVVLAGWVPNAAMAALPVFDVFFQPSLWEAMSVAILEAMAAAKPIVATQVGENGAILDDDVNGLLVEARDVEGMAAAITRLAADPALRLQIGQAAADKVAHGFTLGQMARAYEQLYLETLGS